MICYTVHIVDSAKKNKNKNCDASIILSDLCPRSATDD